MRIRIGLGHGNTLPHSKAPGKQTRCSSLPLDTSITARRCSFGPITGVDTDRLPEEKARGLSIDLGFAYRDLEAGKKLGFVDVPGHEKFIRNMLAGVAAIDFGLLVVAADDGVMPQDPRASGHPPPDGTPKGCGSPDQDRPRGRRPGEGSERRGARSPVPDHARGRADTAGMRAHRRGNRNARGTSAAKRSRAPGNALVEGNFRLAIDRAFSVSGAGTIVTGAAFAGRVSAGGPAPRAAPGNSGAGPRNPDRGP